MKQDPVSKIFDDIDAARDIDRVNEVLETAARLDAKGQKEFLRRLRHEFAGAASRKGKDAFAVISVEPLDRADLKQGFRILYKDPGA
jgi:hypothetical protein